MLTHLKIILLAGLLFCLIPGVSEAKHTIASVSPISHTLSKSITKGTGIDVVYLPPKRLPFNRIPSWVQKNRSKSFAAFDAFVSMSAVVPELDLYPSLRMSNIHIVDIDIAHAIMPNGEKVVLADGAHYFWLDSNNLLVMLGILNRDLTRLWPQHSAQFNQNYHALAASVRQLNLQLDKVLMANQIAFVVADNQRLTPFLNSLASDTGSEQDAIALQLPFIRLTSKKHAPENHWLIDDLARFSDAPLEARLHSHLSGLNRIIRAER